MSPGEIYRHEAFYADPETGELLPKYFVVLAKLPSDDFVIRLLTSKAHGRPEDPRCFHGHPYPSFFLGIPGGALGTKTWADLRYLDDVDALDATRKIQRNVISLSGSVDRAVFAALIDCAAAAEDTTTRQEHALRDHLAAIRH